MKLNNAKRKLDKCSLASDIKAGLAMSVALGVY